MGLSAGRLQDFQTHLMIEMDLLGRELDTFDEGSTVIARLEIGRAHV